MDAAYNLPRWLTRNKHDAEGMVQEAYLGAIFDDIHGTDTPTRLKSLEKDKLTQFDQSILPHMNAAYNLARWLTRNEDDAEDMVQEAYLRAFKFFNTFHGLDGRSWLLSIVRNVCYTWLQQNRAQELTTMFDEETHSVEGDTSNPATLMLQSDDQQIVRQAVEELPVEFREVVVLRELEGFSYNEIAEVAKIPLGTVMSRLARARERLKQLLCNRLKMEC
jgi:RNA polymerase sigma factor (sigma-70 family)